MGETRRLGVGGGLAAALHALVGAWLAFLPQRSAHAAASISHTVEIVVVPSERVRAEPPSPSLVPLPITPAPPRLPSRSHSRSPSVPPSPSPSISPSPSLAPSPPEPRPAVLPLPSLAPADVASALVARDAPGPSMPGPPAPRDLPRVPPIPIRRALARMERSIAHDANRGPFETTDPPHLVARPDGSLTWRGPNFGVVIRPDGEIEFSDEASLQYDPWTGDGSFCIECAFMDPYAGEREWFVEATAAVREEREDRARAEREARALRRLEGRMAALWQSPHASPAERRRRLFELWDESAEDERGRAARELVLQFIRENLPEGAGEAYAPYELASLNASRQSAARFAPY